MKNVESDTILIILMFVLAMTISVNMSMNYTRDYNNPEIKISDFKDNSAGLSICTASVNSWFYVCDNDEYIYWGKPIYNMTQEQMDSMLERCPDGKFIDTTECIGDWLGIIGDR